MKLHIQALPARKSNSRKHQRATSLEFGPHFYGHSTEWCWIPAIPWSTPFPLRSHHSQLFLQPVEKNQCWRENANNWQTIITTKPGAEKKRMCFFSLRMAFCWAAIWISFLFGLAFLLYYYCYSRSSKTIALGNWGLSSKLCFNVLRKSTFFARIWLSQCLFTCVDAVRLSNTCAHDDDDDTSTSAFFLRLQSPIPPLYALGCL